MTSLDVQGAPPERPTPTLPREKPPAAESVPTPAETFLNRGEPWLAEIIAATVLAAANTEGAGKVSAEIANRSLGPTLGFARALAAHAEAFDAPLACTIAERLIKAGFRYEAARLVRPHADTDKEAAYIAAQALSAPENRWDEPWSGYQRLHGGKRLATRAAVARADQLDYAGAREMLRETDSETRLLASFYERTGQYEAWSALLNNADGSIAWVAEDRIKLARQTSNWRSAPVAAPSAGRDLVSRRRLAEVLAEHGQDEQATEYWGAIAANSDDASDHHNYAAALCRTSQFAAAERALESSTRRFAGDYRLQLKLAQLQERRGDFEAALSSLTLGFALEPRNWDSSAGVARCLAYLGRHGEAERWLAQFDQGSLRDGWVHSNRAFNEARAGNARGARRALERLKALTTTLQAECDARRAEDSASVWNYGRFQSHPAAAAATHGAGFAADMAALGAAHEVVLVGNSPRLIGSGKGEAIDRADFVIRLNDFKLHGYERDAGRRIDLWYSSANRVARPNTDAEKASRVWLLQPQAQHLPELPAFALSRLGLPLTTAQARYLPPHVHMLSGSLIYPRPSSGFRMIALLEFLAQRVYSIAGFSFFDDDDMHYFDRGERRLPVGEMHAIGFERDFVHDVLEHYGFLRQL